MLVGRGLFRVCGWFGEKGRRLRCVCLCVFISRWREGFGYIRIYISKESS